MAVGEPEKRAAAVGIVASDDRASLSSSAVRPLAISLLALVVLPVPVLGSVGIAGLLIALVSVAVAVTLLPVVLATIASRLDWPRNRRDARASRAWSAWARLCRASSLGGDIDCGAGRSRRRLIAIQLRNRRADSLAQRGAHAPASRS